MMMTSTDLLILRHLHKQIQSFANTELKKKNTYTPGIIIHIHHKFENIDSLNRRCIGCKQYKRIPHLNKDPLNELLVQKHPTIDHKEYCYDVRCYIDATSLLIDRLGGSKINEVDLGDPQFEERFVEIIKKLVDHA